MDGEALFIDEVSKSFGPVKAVKRLSARIPRGCIYGFLGPNGAGKTTTLRMAMDIIRPDSGRITVLGHPSTTHGRERIGYMPEERGLYRKMKVRALLTYFGRLKGVDSRRLAGEIPRRLDEVGLSDWADRRVEDLSRGMQQKLQFLVTVISDPEFTILDEPFSGLDPVNLETIRDIMLRMREEGRTVIFSTHMMEQAERLCDSILLIHRGEKILDGPLDEVRARYTTPTVRAELEGDISFVEGLPMVERVERDGAMTDIVLREGADSQELLRALVERVRVRSFEEKRASLHEIFVSLVKENDG
ncbi:ATP-binding cassette domain-containing protein [Candidatus Sumerlaeota bacterium]|nr:ATP-binding cassette domain-containing protein [Candidatus Sumerlaeota bacterium]